ASTYAETGGVGSSESHPKNAKGRRRKAGRTEAESEFAPSTPRVSARSRVTRAAAPRVWYVPPPAARTAAGVPLRASEPVASPVSSPPGTPSPFSDPVETTPEAEPLPGIRLQDGFRFRRGQQVFLER